MKSVIYLLMCIGAACALPGCGGGSGVSAAALRGPIAKSPTSIVARGDWNDVLAAVTVAVPSIDAAVLKVTSAGDEQRFEIETAGADPGWLVAVPDGSADPKSPDPIRIRLTAAVGLFGDPAREAKLLEATRKRLADLAGVGFAPLR